MPRKAKELIDEQPALQEQTVTVEIAEQEQTSHEQPVSVELAGPIEPTQLVKQTIPKSVGKGHTPFSFLNVRELDKNLSVDEMQEWNSIYASYRSKSILSGVVTGVDENRFEVTNADTGQRETKSHHLLQGG